MEILVCPVCGQPLNKNQHTFCCEANHCYDIAKEGYVNLLSAHKSGDNVGDNKDMARSRRDFLSKGFYISLANAVKDCLAKYTSNGDNVLDICCGEGYYTAHLADELNRNYYGFDISKNMIKLAAKRKCNAEFFVANIANIPVKTGSVDFAFHLFAPFHSKEFSRILSDKGVLVSAIPGSEHLLEIKKVLYEKPYLNDEGEPESEGLQLVDRIRVKTKINLDSSEDIMALFKMTPYYYHTPSGGMAKLEELRKLETTIEFVLLIYKKEL